MTLERCIAQAFPVKCTRCPKNEIAVLIYQRVGNNTNISSQVNCEHNYGSHGEKCKLKKDDLCLYRVELGEEYGK